MLLPVAFRGTRLLASRLRRGTFLPILALALGLAGAGHAATLSVTTTADSGPGSLRAALAASSADGDGDVIIFDPVVFAARQTISVTGPILFAYAGVNIQGPAAGVVLDGSTGIGDPCLVFESDTATSFISNLTIQNFGDSGLTNTFGTVTATNCVIQNNTAEHGAGVSNEGVLTMIGCTVANNTTSQDGAGLVNGGTLTMTDCTISGNVASNYGGGGIEAGPITTLTNCTIANNVAGGSDGGGGIASIDGGILTVTNCTFTGNQAAAANNAYGGGGAIAIVRGTTTLTNDIFSGDSSPQGDGDEIFFNNNNNGNPGTVTITHCDLAAAVYGAAYTDGGGSLSADPRLGPLQNNGGLTQTRALLPGSPCIDAGTSAGAPATDQRGAARVGPTDIGAYEFGSVPPASGHTHLLWNNSDGRVMLWSIAADGSFTLNGFGPYTDGAPQNKWSATAVATGPDGKGHLLWNNTDGRVMLWTVDDSGSFTLAGYGPYTDNAPQNVWHAAAVSVGLDNIVHLLWSNTDGRAMLWNVAADFTFTLAGYGPYTDGAPQNKWSATALATGPDGVSHILWNNTDHRVMLWNVDSAFSLLTYAGYGPYTDGAPQNLWSAGGVSVGPDNVQHLLWSNTDRRAMFWDVGADFSFMLAGYGPYTDNAPGNLWSAAALATGPDGLSHLLWGNTDHRAMLWGVDSAFDFTVAGYGPYTDNAPGNLWSVTAVSAGP